MLTLGAGTASHHELTKAKYDRTCLLLEESREISLIFSSILTPKRMINPYKFFAAFATSLAAARWVIGALLLLFGLLSAMLATFEQKTLQFWDAIYLSAITALTVGYGDLSPKTVGGRLAAIGLALLGVLFVGIVVAAAIKALEEAAKP